GRLHLPGIDRGLAHADRRDLGLSEDRRRDVAQPQRLDRLAERVPHGDPALHRRDRGQHQDAGAVAARAHAGRRGPGHLVRDHEALVVHLHPGLVQPQAPGRGHHPDGEQAVGAAHRPAVVRVTATPRPSGLTPAARDRLSTVIPRLRNTSSTTIAASGSSFGSTRSREEISVTWEPSAWYALANSAPVTPEPTTTSSSGSSARS